MPVVTREWSIVYGSLTVGGSSDAFFLTKQGTGIFESYSQARISFGCWVIGTSEDDFKTQNQTFLNALRTPRARLQVKTPDGLRDYNPTAGASTNTGFDAVPEVEKVENRFNSGRSRLYRATITVSLPADLTGQSGRQDSQVETQYDINNRRTIQVTGRYTALAANEATAQYVASGLTYGLSVLPAGNWQFIDEKRVRNDTDKTLDFVQSYRLITLPQSAAGADHASVRDQAMNVAREFSGVEAGFFLSLSDQPEAPPLVKGLASYRVEYRGVIDITVTTYDQLKALWDSTLEAHVTAQARDRIGADVNASAVDASTLDLDLEGNVITASFRMRALNGSLLISREAQVEQDEDEGLAVTPVSNGDAFAAALDAGPKEHILVQVLDETLAGPGFRDVPAPPQGYVMLNTRIEKGGRRIGLAPNTIDLRRRRITRRYRRVNPYGGRDATSGVSSAGGGRVTSVERNPQGGQVPNVPGGGQ